MTSGQERSVRSVPASAGARYRQTFGLAVAVVYTGGTVAQSLKLVFAFGWEYMPFWVDWVLIVLGTYGGVGLILFARQVAWRGTWEKVVHGLMAAHLLVSVGVHAWIVAIGSHEFFTIFPYEYSYFAVAYFGVFAWRAWTMKLVPPSGVLRSPQARAAAASREPPADAAKLTSHEASPRLQNRSDEEPTMNARTLDGHEIDVPQAALDGLKLRLKGPVLVPGDAAYDESRTVWNAMIDRRPALVVRCLGTADVIACVQFAREHRLLLCIKGGGHNIAGLATADGALMLDLSLMRGVWVDAQAKVAHAQAGCLLGDVDRETQVHGLATVLGFVSLTGIAGLTLGGGFGYLTRRWGWTTDNVIGMDVVTADARLVRATSSENPDLFWGLRGGGGNFGVVTGIDYMLHPVGPEVVGGVVAWAASAAPDVLKLFTTLAEKAPPELTLVTFMRPAPPAPWLPTDMHGKPIVAILACHSGNPAEGENAVAAIKAFGTPIGDVLVRRPYAQLQALLDGTQPKGRRYYWKSEYLARIDPALCEKFMAHAAKIRSPHSAMILFQIDGALNRLEDQHSPVGNRDARYVLNIGGAWEQAADDTVNVTWARDAWNDLKAFSTGGTYINFLTEDEGPDRIEAALGGGLARLAEVKARWDPENVFRANRNITPRGSDRGERPRSRR